MMDDEQALWAEVDSVRAIIFLSIDHNLQFISRTYFKLKGQFHFYNSSFQTPMPHLDLKSN